MSLHTEIEGDPASCRATQSWLANVLDASVEDVGDAVASARRTVEDEWEGAAGSAAADKLSRGLTEIDALHAAISKAARAVGDLAGDLETAQRRMIDARERACGAGLVVTATHILPPSPPPPVPLGDAPKRIVDAMTAAIKDYTAQAAVYDSLRPEVAAARAIWDNARDEFGRLVAAASDERFLTTLSAVGALSETRSHWDEKAKAHGQVADILDKTETDSKFVRETLDEARTDDLDAAERNRLLAQLAKAADKAGLAGDLLNATYQLREGEEPEKVIAELVGGEIGATLGAAVGGGLFGPPGAAAGAFVGGLAGEKAPEVSAATMAELQDQLTMESFQEASEDDLMDKLKDKLTLDSPPGPW